MSAQRGGTPIVIGLQLQDDAALLEGFIEFSAAIVRPGEIAVRDQRQRVELHGALRFRQCLVQPPQQSQVLRICVVGAHMAGVQVDRPLIRLSGARPIPISPHQDPAECNMGFRETVVELQCSERRRPGLREGFWQRQHVIAAAGQPIRAGERGVHDGA